VANLCWKGLEKLKSVLLGSGNTTLAEIAARDQTYWKPFEEKSVLLHNIAPDLADRNKGTVYPAVYLYAAKVENLPRQKFAGFSGPIRLVADLRSTGERYEGLEREITTYVEAVTTALLANTGSWGDGLIYSGAYAVKFETVKLGGRNFIQSAKVELEVEACG